MTDISERSIADLSAAFQTGELTSSRVVDDALAHIDAHEAKLEAFEIVLADKAREAAEAATTAIRTGHRIGPFHGIPFALKDLVDVEGLATTGGTLVHADNVATRTATIAKRLIAAGGILIGKTKTVEVAYGAWGTNQVRGTPWNPWDGETKRMPGGSSSGSGVAVAARMATCAVGTDTGGSVRIPAAACGLAGLKVTEGRLPLDGIVPLAHSLDTPGPMTRTVLDAALMFEVLDGRHPVETSADLDAETGLFAPPNIAGLVLGAMPQSDRDGITPEVLERYDAALDRLKSLGAQIVTFDLPVPHEHMKRDVATIISAEGYYHHGDMYEAASNRVDTDVKPRILYGAKITSKQLIEAQVRRVAHRDATVAEMRRHGIAALLTPTLPFAPPALDDIDQSGTAAILTRSVNYLGFCAMTVPMGLTGDGLPTGLQTIAPGNSEAIAIRIAAAFEADQGLIGPPPMIG